MTIMHVAHRNRDKHQQNGKVCWYCGRTVTWAHRGRRMRARFATFDHQLPLSRGGTNAAENKVTSCLACNQRKGNRTVEEYRAALLSGELHVNNAPELEYGKFWGETAEGGDATCLTTEQSMETLNVTALNLSTAANP